MKYFLAFIGGGPAGYTAAEKASKAGKDVVLFEQNALGGTCLNVGCIPTKSLLYGAKQYYNATHAQKYGVTAEGVAFDFGAMQKRKTIVVRKLVAGIKQRLNNEHCTVVNGAAKVCPVSPQGEECCYSVEANGECYEAENLMICTGSTNFVPPIPGIKDNPNVWDSTDALAATELPKSVIIVGEAGIKILTSTKVESLDGGKVTANGEVYEAERVLVSVGRRANLQGLEELKEIELERGAVKVDEFCKTNLPNVYACGDVTGKVMLAHVASRQAEVAVGRMLKEIPLQRIVYHAIPSVVYTNPEIASVGLTEKQTEEMSLPVEVRKLPMTFSGRFMAENEGETGLCKVIIDRRSQTVVGVHCIGNPCSEFIAAASFAVRNGYTLPEMKQVVFPHPTVSEILHEIL